MLQTTMDAFMKYNPPCKECLVRSMCLTFYLSNYLYSSPVIKSKPCNILYEFLLNNKNFRLS